MRNWRLSGGSVFVFALIIQNVNPGCSLGR